MGWVGCAKSRKQRPHIQTQIHKEGETKGGHWETEAQDQIYDILK